MFARQNLVQMKVYPKELSSHTFSSKILIAILKLIYQKQQYHYFLYVTNFQKQQMKQISMALSMKRLEDFNQEIMLI